MLDVFEKTIMIRNRIALGEGDVVIELVKKREDFQWLKHG